MNLVKCNSGHFYDAERYETCPHCSGAVGNDNLTMPVNMMGKGDDVTVALNQNPAPQDTMPLTEAMAAGGGSSLQDAVKAAQQGNLNNSPIADDDNKTVGFFSSLMGVEPVVGWLVCVVGEHFGEDFRLKSGRNFIGRGSGMDVCISKDLTVSRDRHGIVIYEPRGNMFLIQPGDSKELCYLNGEVVLSPQKLNAHDRILVGKTELMFMPCCTATFTWENIDQN